MTHLALVQELIRITEQQLDAARALDGAALGELNGQRADRTFELHVQLQDGISDEERPELATRFAELRALEIRLERVAGTVANVLDTARPPKRVATYGRRGRIG